VELAQEQMQTNVVLVYPDFSIMKELVYPPAHTDIWLIHLHNIVFNAQKIVETV